MTMRLTEFGKTRTALPGVPWRDLTNAEWADAKRRHPGIEDQGYFEKFEEPTDEADAKPKARAGRPQGSDSGGSASSGDEQPVTHPEEN